MNIQAPNTSFFSSLNLSNISSQLSNILPALILVLLIILLIRTILQFFHQQLKQLKHDLVLEIRSSIQPKFIEASVNAKELIELTEEVWRLENRLKKATEHLPENQTKGFESSLLRLKRFLGKYDLEAKEYTGQKYNSGLVALDVVSVEKEPSTKEDFVKETLEPAIFLKGQVIKKSKVVLQTKE